MKKKQKRFWNFLPSHRAIENVLKHRIIEYFTFSLHSRLQPTHWATFFHSSFSLSIFCNWSKFETNSSIILCSELKIQAPVIPYYINGSVLSGFFYLHKKSTNNTTLQTYFNWIIIICVCESFTSTKKNDWKNAREWSEEKAQRIESREETKYDWW